MLLLSLGAEAITALLRGEGRREFSGPDLSWLLFGPDTYPGDSGTGGPAPAGVVTNDTDPLQK